MMDASKSGVAVFACARLSSAAGLAAIGPAATARIPKIRNPSESAYPE